MGTSDTLLQSLGLNVGVAIVCIVPWLVGRAFKAQKAVRAELPEHCRSSRSGDVAGAHNYLLYLWVCGCMCLTLTTIRQLILLAYGSGIYTGLWSGENVVYTLLELDHNSGVIAVWGIMCSVLDGCVVLVFSRVIELLARPQVFDPEMRERAQRTLWLTHIPKRDRTTSWPFVLKDVDIFQVRQDLIKAIDDRLGVDGVSDDSVGLFKRWVSFDQYAVRHIAVQQRPASATSPASSCPSVMQRVRPVQGEAADASAGRSTIESCCVALDLDDWYTAKSKLDLTVSYISAREEMLKEVEQQLESTSCVGLRSCWSRCCPVCGSWHSKMRRAYLQCRLRRLRQAEGRLIRACSKASQAKKLSGSAFVTFKTKEDRDLMLGESGPCWQCRRHSYFSFGRPPFSSVTLACRRAPAPADVEWRNLQVGSNRRRLTFWTATFLLLVFMFLLVTPITLVDFCTTVLRGAKSAEATVEKALQVLPEPVRAGVLRNMEAWGDGVLWPTLLDQMPTLVLLCINALILPCVIEAIGKGQRSAQKSMFEMNQKRLNHVFLLLNTIVFPFLGVSTMSAAAQEAPHVVQDFVHTLRVHIAESSAGVYGLKYVLNAAFISSTIALTNISQVLVNSVAGCFAVTEEERRQIHTPWPFAWGYWYAWTLSILALTVLTSLLIPAMLPLATVFFFFRYGVDSHNLRHGVYALVTDVEGSLVLAAVRDMKTTVGAGWVLEGLALCSGAPLLSTTPTYFRVTGALLTALGLAVIGLSHWNFQQQHHILVFRGEHPDAPPRSVFRTLAALFELPWHGTSPSPPAEQQSLLGGVPGSEASRSEDQQARDDVHWDGARLLGLAGQ